MTQCPKHQHWDRNTDCWQCLTESEGTAFDITSDFIQEQKEASARIQAINLVKPRQKFAPYSKAERDKRRKEVARLHFELGMPAVRIAELMKVDRNTVNADLRTLYRELGEPGTSVNDTYNLFYR